MNSSPSLSNRQDPVAPYFPYIFLGVIVLLSSLMAFTYWLDVASSGTAYLQSRYAVGGITGVLWVLVNALWVFTIVEPELKIKSKRYGYSETELKKIRETFGPESDTALKSIHKQSGYKVTVNESQASEAENVKTITNPLYVFGFIVFNMLVFLTVDYAWLASTVIEIAVVTTVISSIAGSIYYLQRKEDRKKRENRAARRAKKKQEQTTKLTEESK